MQRNSERLGIIISIGMVLAGLLALASLAPPTGHAHSYNQGEIAVSHTWPSPTYEGGTAVYGAIISQGKQTERLSDVLSDLAECHGCHCARPSPPRLSHGRERRERDGGMSPIILLGGDRPSSCVVARALKERFDDVRIVVEAPESRSVFLKRRMRHLGPCTVARQILFVALGRPLAARARTRRQAILAANGLSDAPLPEAQITRVSSVNAAETVALLQVIAPAVVVVNGTRIIARHVLESVSAPFINMHAGITPTYRGSHGAYWALVNDDRDHCGVTIHLVDAGIDTGDIVYQGTIQPGTDGNFFTYPALQLAAGLPLLIQAVQDALNDELRPRSSDLPSAVRTHPTILQYFWNGWRKGVW